MEIVLATHNLHKIREMRAMLKGLENIDIFSLSNFPDYRLPEETGETFEENAKLKAEHAAKALGKWTLADDSGLVVPALVGKPGVYSTRFAGEDATDAENRKKLLEEMKDLKEIDHSAFFECTLVLANPEGIVKTVTGTCHGTIIDSEKGRNGFGYDSIFVKNDYDKTFAEIGEDIKNRVSHRRKAIDKIFAFLESLKE